MFEDFAMVHGRVFVVLVSHSGVYCFASVKESYSLPGVALDKGAAARSMNLARRGFTAERNQGKQRMAICDFGQWVPGCR